MCVDTIINDAYWCPLISCCSLQEHQKTSTFSDMSIHQPAYLLTWPSMSTRTSATVSMTQNVNVSRKVCKIVHLTCVHTCLQHTVHTDTTIHVIHTYVHTYIPTCLPTYIHTYIHTHTHTYVHIHLCTHTYIRTHVNAHISWILCLMGSSPLVKSQIFHTTHCSAV